MNFFQQLFNEIIYRPELNLLQLFYNLTSDIGFAIILLSVLVNLMLWPLLVSAYVNGQKMRILQPKLREIQEKYKDDREALFRETMNFTKKHKINNGTIIWVLLGQIFFITGLFSLTSEVSQGKEIVGLYTQFFGKEVASFSTEAFGFLNIGAPASQNIWLPILNLVLSFLYGMYVYKWAPKPNLPEPKKTDKKDPNQAFDPEAFNKTMEFQTIYVMPIFLFLFNYNLTTGINLYAVTASIISLTRQIFISYFYKFDSEKLLSDIAESDPTSKDKNISNNIENTGPADILADSPQATLVLDKKVSTKQKKQTAKKKVSTKKKK